MIRKAFLMRVHRDCQQEYEKRHNPIWPELEAVLREHGARNYSIFLNAASGDLFAYVEIEDQERWDRIASTEVCKKWWAHMKEIMPSHADNSPISTELREVFHLP
jgi:L-rhamnose mutarotase